MPPTLTQAHLLEVAERQFPDSYIDPIKNIGPGYELLQGFAKVGERCSLAVDRAESDAYILSAQGPKQATVDAIFYRATTAAGGGVVLPGTIVMCSGGGQMFRTLVAAEFGPSDLEVTVPAIATGYGYEWNIRGKTTIRGESAPGDLDTVELPLQDPPHWDPSIKVRNDADADGLGRPGVLDTHGGDRLVRRAPGESDANYRARIRSLPDTITPAAFRRQLTQFFLPYGITWKAIETWDPAYQNAYDWASDADPIFVYDDPRVHIPIANRWYDENDREGAFIVELELTSAIREYGMAYDDPESGFTTPNGFRAVSAMDLPDTLPNGLVGGAYDAEDEGTNEMIGELAQLLENIKGAGIKATIHIAGDD